MLGNIGFKMINNDQTYVIERTFVAEQARGQGLAEKMTVFFLEHARCKTRRSYLYALTRKNILQLILNLNTYYSSKINKLNLKGSFT